MRQRRKRVGKLLADYLALGREIGMHLSDKASLIADVLLYGYEWFVVMTALPSA